MALFHCSHLGHVVLPEPDFGRPSPNGDRVVRPGRKKGGRRA
jgi:hypothetical protein